MVRGDSKRHEHLADSSTVDEVSAYFWSRWVQRDISAGMNDVDVNLWRPERRWVPKPTIRIEAFCWPNIDRYELSPSLNDLSLRGNGSKS